VSEAVGVLVHRRAAELREVDSGVRAIRVTAGLRSLWCSKRLGELELSAKEFAVPEALPRASPGALSAEQLLLKAWDKNADPLTRTV
jgi:DNA-binding response OmpR family regulator